MNEQKRKPIGILLTVILIAALLTICLELGLSYLRPDTPGSIPKHLIHFAIMFILLGGAVLLCLFCPPFKKLWAWIDEHILDKETRPIAIDIIYAVIAGLMLLHHFYVILYYPTIPAGATKFAPIWIVLAAVTVLLDKSWQKTSFRLAALFLICTFERLYFKKLSITSNNMVFFASAIYALFICLGLFSTLHSSVRKSFLKVLCALWALATLVLCLASLYNAWTGAQIKNLAGSTIYLFEGRLSVFAIPTITSSILGCACIMALVGFALSEHILTKISFLFIAFISMVTNSLTDSRSSFIILATMLAGMICIGLWTIYQNKKALHSTKKTILIITSLAICFAICFFVAVEGQRILGLKFVEIRNKGNIIISTAKAEEIDAKDQLESIVLSQPPQFEQRDVWLSNEASIDNTLSGRIGLWKIILDYIQNNPQNLLCGLSIDGSVAPAIGWPAHCHNLLLQNLLENGLPSLFLLIALFSYGIGFSLRIWKRNNASFWMRVLPLPMVSILLWETVECLSHFSYGHPPMTLLWFFLGATITVSKSLGKAPKTTEQPAIPAESAVTETGE